MTHGAARTCLLAAAALATTTVAVAGEPRDRGSLGVSALTAAEVPALPPGSGGPWPAALEVVLVVPGSAGERAGVRTGDLVLELDGSAFDPADGDPAAQYRERLRALPRGRRVTLTILRREAEVRAERDGRALEDASEALSDLRRAVAALPDGGRLRVDALREDRILRVEAEMGPHPFDLPPRRTVPTDAEIHPALLAQETAIERFASLAAESAGTAAAADDLGARLSRVAAFDDGFHLDDVRFVQRHPGKVALVAADALAALAPSRPAPTGAPLADAGLSARIRAVAARDRADLSALSFPPLPRGVSAQAHSDALVALLAETAALRDLAFLDLTLEEKDFLAAHWTDLAGALAEQAYLHADPDPARRRRVLRLLDLAGRVRRDALHVAALSWARLADPEWLRAVREDLLADPRAADEYVLRRSTPHGEIVVGGTGPNRYRGFEPAVVIDLGGDDVHSNGAGSSLWAGRPVAAVVDLGGDDAYESTSAGAQGAGIGGVGLLVDTAGDDRYLASDFSQAASALGVGALVDVSGDDVYRARRLSQGLGLWGSGFLLDLAGDDLHEGLGYVQGVGLPGGFGVLHDAGGDDRYFAKGGTPTGYGTAGVFDAWSQGCGFGFRMLQSGGMGILADDAGSDEYEAGSFAQGGGYYLGWGLLHDRGSEDDLYLGSRYDQGFAAHQAVGTFLDDGGDDRYVTRDGVIGGIAWDEGVALFVDAGGDDVHRAGFFSLGASAHNGYAVFVDADGSDVYEGAQPARAGPNDYHGGTSVSLFLDLGEGADSYAGRERGSVVEMDGEHGVFADLPGVLEQHLTRQAFARRVKPAARGTSGPGSEARAPERTRGGKGNRKPPR